MRISAVIPDRTRLLQAALLAAALGLGLNLGGCANVPGGAMNAQAGMTTGATVAFESVDGPPPQLFDRMVNLLDSEARLRNLSVVSRKDNAAFRVRSYLAAQIRGNQTSIAWVWDVYDRDQQRALRLSGEESTGKGNRDAWAAVDDLVLRRIAQAGLTGLTGLINGATPGDTAPPARDDGPAIAALTPADAAPSDSASLPPQATAFAEVR